VHLRRAGSCPLQFHDLSVAAVTRETPDSVCIAFDVPEDLRDLFRYRPGQHLTLRATIGGEDVRRSYSICSGLGEGRLRVGVKKVDGGVFSAFVNDGLNAGDIIQVMPPQGRFAVDVAENAAHNYLMIAAGSGITPVLSIIRSTLEGEPASEVTLVYGNRETASIMFREELEDLKDRISTVSAPSTSSAARRRTCRCSTAASTRSGSASWRAPG
jgi:ring-1,2-phenylacetyl-CoA epoxidase subunit PaaE